MISINDVCDSEDVKYETCDILPDDKDDVELLQNYAYKMEYKNKSIRLNLKYRKDWKLEIDEDLIRWTNSQKN